MDEIKLRPHHGLCIRFFKGHGYSEEFTGKMKETIARLEKGENFTLTSGMDTLCAYCPNNKEGVCTSEEKVKRYDSAVLEDTEIKSGTRTDWKSLYDKVTDKSWIRAFLKESAGTVPGGTFAIKDRRSLLMFFQEAFILSKLKSLKTTL